MTKLKLAKSNILSPALSTPRQCGVFVKYRILKCCFFVKYRISTFLLCIFAMEFGLPDGLETEISL